MMMISQKKRIRKTKICKIIYLIYRNVKNFVLIIVFLYCICAVKKRMDRITADENLTVFDLVNNLGSKSALRLCILEAIIKKGTTPSAVTIHKTEAFYEGGVHPPPPTLLPQTFEGSGDHSTVVN